MFRHGNDLRVRVIEFLEKGNTKSKTAEVFNIAKQTLYSWISLQKEHKLLEVKQYTSIRSKLNDNDVKEFIDMHPDWYFYEIAKHFNTSDESIRRAFKRIGYSVKKNKRYLKNQTES